MVLPFPFISLWCLSFPSIKYSADAGNTPHEEVETENRSVPASTDCLYFRQHTRHNPKFRKEHSPTSYTFSEYWTGFLLNRKHSKLLVFFAAFCLVFSAHWRPRALCTFTGSGSHYQRAHLTASGHTKEKKKKYMSLQITLYRTSHKWAPRRAQRVTCKRRNRRNRHSHSY
jgi:hypothetical protein